jgi:hypothetical protein
VQTTEPQSTSAEQTEFQSNIQYSAKTPRETIATSTVEAAARQFQVAETHPILQIRTNTTMTQKPAPSFSQKLEQENSNELIFFAVENRF